MGWKMDYEMGPYLDCMKEMTMVSCSGTRKVIVWVESLGQLSVAALVAQKVSLLKVWVTEVQTDEMSVVGMDVARKEAEWE
jgi:hypothetical protein